MASLVIMANNQTREDCDGFIDGFLDGMLTPHYAAFRSYADTLTRDYECIYKVMAGITSTFFAGMGVVCAARVEDDSSLIFPAIGLIAYHGTGLTAMALKTLGFFEPREPQLGEETPLDVTDEEEGTYATLQDE